MPRKSAPFSRHSCSVKPKRPVKSLKKDAVAIQTTCVTRAVRSSCTPASGAVASLLALALSTGGCNRSSDEGVAGNTARQELSSGAAGAPSTDPRFAGTSAVAIGGRAASTTTATGNSEDEDPASNQRWSEAALRNRAVPEDGPRLYAKTRHVWIYAEPDATKQWIGYLWSGGSVRLRSAKPKYGIGCEFFYAIEPRGYVCIDGGRATVDPKDPIVVALHPYAPRYDSPWPHRYGESRGTPLYYTLPSELDQKQREIGLARHLQNLEAARRTGHGEGALLGVDLAPAENGVLEFPKLSPSVHEAHAALKNRSTVAYTRELRYGNRDFLVTADYRFVPKDRVVPYPVSRYHGIRLNENTKLPLAMFRRDQVTRYRKNSANEFEPTHETYERLAFVELTGQTARVSGSEFLETRNADWIKRDTAVVPTPAEKTPWDAVVGHPDASPSRPKGRATWIEVSIRGGWLIAYEETTPVFVTLISPGRGGEATRGRDPLETSATPLGRFSITGKFVTSTMVAPNDYLHSDVPFAQNFTGPYALHSAYWHDQWGNLMSGGCINLSPIDALFMFHWTEPEAPPGWHGTRWLPYLEPATTLIIRR